MEAFPLSHSGAVLRREGATFVKQGSARLLVCAAKQAANANPWLRSPRVLSVTSTGATTTFVQEWVDAARFPLADARDAALATGVAAGYVLSNVRAGWVDVAPMLHRLDRVACDAELRRTVRARLANALLVAGPTHGDMTYCNLLVTDDDVWAVDWLDTVIDSPLLDAVKLRQDTFSGWAARLAVVDVAAVAAADARLHTTFMASLPGYASSWQSVAAWSLLRIVDYAKDDATRRWAEHEAVRCLNTP